MRLAIKKCIYGAFFLLVLAACGKWGTMDKAEQFYHGNKDVFHRIYSLVAKNRELKEISDVYDPYGNIEFLPRYGDFDDTTKAAYVEVLALLKYAHLDGIRIERFQRRSGQEIEIVKFIVFSRGIGGDAEGVEITHFVGSGALEDFKSPSTVCKHIDGEHWFVCHVK